MNFLLKTAISCGLLEDHKPYRKAIISAFIDENAFLKIANNLFYKSRILSSFFFIFYFMRSFFILRFSRTGKLGGFLAIAFNESEQRHIHRVLCDNPSNWGFKGNLLAFQTLKRFIFLLRHIRRLPQLFRLSVVLRRRSDNIVVFLRVSEILGLFFALKKYAPNFSTMVYSSDANPWGFAAHYYARIEQKETFFIPHGLLFCEPNKMAHSQIFFQTKLCQDAFLKNPCEPSQFDYKPIRFEPLLFSYKKPLICGLLLSKSLDFFKCCELLEELSKLREVGEIRLRIHPSFSLKGVKQFMDFSKVVMSQDRDIASFLIPLDFCIVGNSSAALDSLIAGKPILFREEIDLVKGDSFGLISSGVIDPTCRSLSDLDKSIYLSPPWVERMNRLYA